MSLISTTIISLIALSHASKKLLQTSCKDGEEMINGVCVDKCGGFENCIVYSDGCNQCDCGADGTGDCTTHQCVWQGIPSCITCDDGYQVNNRTCEEIPTCGGYEYCASYVSNSFIFQISVD